MSAAKKPKSSKAVAPNPKRKLVLQSCDSKAASPPPFTKKPRTSKTNPTWSPLVLKPIVVVLVSQITEEQAVSVKAIEKITDLKDAEKTVATKEKVFFVLKKLLSISKGVVINI